MSDVDEKLLLKLKKLLNLSKQGVGGEARNAQSFLTKLLEKNNMTISDLADEDEVSGVKFGYKNEFERRLILQVFSKVINSGDASYFLNTRNRYVKMELKASEHAEMLIHLSALKPALKKHFDLAFSAFVNANNIFPDDTEAGESTLSDSERWALANMIQGTVKTQIYKAIGE